MKKYQMIKFYISRIYKNIYRFIRWGVFSAIVGIVVGSFSTLFAYCLRVVTEIRTQHPEIIFALPLGGIVIVALYGIFKYKMIREQILFYLQFMLRVKFRSKWLRLFLFLL